MKTVLRFSLATCLIVALSSSALAVKPPLFFGDSVPVDVRSEIEIIMNTYSPGEHLFFTEEQGARLQFQGLFGYDGADMTLVQGEYTLNDFVYGDLVYSERSDAVNLRGGYLWEDLGVFASLDYADMSMANGYIVSGGYRFDLGGGSYTALSLEYSGGDIYGGSFAGQAIVKYYADGLKLSGQLFVDDDGNYLIHGKANVAAGDRLVWGGGLTWYDSDRYAVFAGLTWTGEKSLFDGIVNLDDAGNTIYYLSYLYSISDALALGLNYIDGDMGGGLVGLKGQYQLGGGAMTFSYTTSTEGLEGGFIGLGYEKSL